MKYRKKPIEVFAFRFGIDPKPDWCAISYSQQSDTTLVWIPESSERCLVKHGYWVVKEGNSIDTYRNDIFNATYEAVE